MLARSGALADMIDAGARILKVHAVPVSVWVRLRQTRFRLGPTTETLKAKGTASAKVYRKPETAAASAISGVLTDRGEPRPQRA